MKAAGLALLLCACGAESSPTAPHVDAGTTQVVDAGSQPVVDAGNPTQACIDSCLGVDRDGGAQCDSQCDWAFAPGSHDRATCYGTCSDQANAGLQSCESRCP